MSKYSHDPVRWVGLAITKACAKSDSFALALVRLVQEQAGQGAAGEILSALHDADIPTSGMAVAKREVAPERRAQLTAQLAKARAARKAKPQPFAPGPRPPRRAWAHATVTDVHRTGLPAWCTCQDCGASWPEAGQYPEQCVSPDDLL